MFYKKILFQSFYLQISHLIVLIIVLIVIPYNILDKHFSPTILN